MEDPNVASRRRLQKVYTAVREPTRRKLKTIARLQGISLFELIETLFTDYIRGWQELHKLDLDKQASKGAGKAAKSTAKRARVKK